MGNTQTAPQEPQITPFEPDMQTNITPSPLFAANEWPFATISRERHDERIKSIFRIFAINSIVLHLIYPMPKRISSYPDDISAKTMVREMRRGSRRNFAVATGSAIVQLLLFNALDYKNSKKDENNM